MSSCNIQVADLSQSEFRRHSWYWKQIQGIIDFILASIIGTLDLELCVHRHLQVAETVSTASASSQVFPMM